MSEEEKYLEQIEERKQAEREREEAAMDQAIDDANLIQAQADRIAVLEAEKSELIAALKMYYHYQHVPAKRFIEQYPQFAEMLSIDRYFAVKNSIDAVYEKYAALDQKEG